MRSRVLAILFFVFVLSCKAKDSTPADIENDLKKTMQTYLYNTIHNDSSNVKYRVKDVIYYDDKERNIYICEFTVNLKDKLFDTTGIMKANISRDFKKVVRLY